ncbi:MAG: MBL fold metallo-hydrolase [Armatimonadota bacterium]|nr:MBL fold metallo-hydrolase [Armatimonadota bacterium]MDR7450925.1 MBL fold metallo-hydrolase [Armatimonadota bacterium]MDR7465847.1 MBL fold metallo-hydrolase [Armatimonadota bacterium]MDR7493755.1 MBL fold metallo-hydrolase [Armatimonadota bacterium]MDR7498361.1 MBL fold metallo-hydrolase [Armatimonadota bacterium]
MGVRRLADDLVLIDTGYNSTPEAIGVYLLLGDPPGLVETGPASCADTVLHGVRQAGVDPADLQALAVTHIHLDHAGGAGALARRLPRARVYVHPVGAPHLLDPTRLLASAGRLYGNDLVPLFGETVPVPADRLHILRDGELLAIGRRRLRAVDTPGHARHHHAYWDEETGDLFSGDIAGVALPGSRYVRAPTPPPELDIPAWQASLRRIRQLGPRRLLLTHFGAHDWVDDLLAQLEERLQEGVDRVREALAAGLDAAAITARMREQARRQIEARDGVGAAARYEVIMPVRQSVLGLIRYIEKTG